MAVRPSPSIARLLAVGSLGGALGCSGGVIPRASAPESPTELSKCRVMASQLSPLVTEWPASEKANLEARLRDGGVAVAYSGCEMRLLPECRPGGHYRWQRTSTATDSIEIHNEDELYAKLPLGAVSLEGELMSSGRLAMQTTVAGQLRLEDTSVAQVRPEGPCRNAPHLVGAMSVGAFKLKSGGALRAGAGVTAPIGSGSIATESSETVLREAGSPGTCGESTDEAPHGECRSPIQVFLAKLPWVEAEEVPAGMVRVAFSSADADTTWDVVAGGRKVCETPCEQLVTPSTSVTLRDQDPSFLSPSDEVEVPPLDPYLGDPGVEVRADTYSFGLWMGGLTLTGLGGGLALMGGILAPIGCTREGSDGSTSGMCPMGIGVAIAGGVMIVPGIIMMLASGPDAELQPLGTVRSSESSLWLGPGGFGGTF